MEQAREEVAVRIKEKRKPTRDESITPDSETAAEAGTRTLTSSPAISLSQRSRKRQQEERQVEGKELSKSSSPPEVRDLLPFSTSSHNPTFLLTQAAHITTTEAGSTSSSKLSSPKVTPPAGAMESPGSPESAASPESKNNLSSNPTSKTNRKRGVPHVYRDYLNVPDTIGYVRKKTGGVTQPFPEKLHDLLESNCEPNIICWLPHGRAFIVRKPKEFTQNVMPR